MLYCDIFRPGVLNIFTDASIKTLNNPKEVIGCPGAICVYTTPKGIVSILDEAYYVERCATNNSSEIKAISLGVFKAIQYQYSFDTINLFSDSKICILGVREWIFNWITNIKEGIMYSSSGTPVANQSTFATIANNIVYNNLKINFYHQKGHVNTNNQKQVSNAIDVFKVSNYEYTDEPLMITLSDFNNMVDIRTGVVLDNFYREENMNFSKESVAYMYDMSIFDAKKYRQLINTIKGPVMSFR